MTNIDHERFKRRPIKEREVSDDTVTAIVARHRGPSKADLRKTAEQAVAQHKGTVTRGSGATAKRPVATAGVTTPASNLIMPITITCQCGHSATIQVAPATLIGRRLRCTSCGEEPLPSDVKSRLDNVATQPV